MPAIELIEAKPVYHKSTDLETILSDRRTMAILDWGAADEAKYKVQLKDGETLIELVGQPKVMMRKEYAELAINTQKVAETIPVRVMNELIKTILEKPTARRIFRSITIPKGSGNTVYWPHLGDMFEGIGELAEVPTMSDTDLETGGGVTARVLKYGLRATVNLETEEDSPFNWSAEVGRRMGESFAEYEDRLIYNQIYEQTDPEQKEEKTSGYWNDPVGWETNIRNDITKMINQMRRNKIKPTHIVVNPQASLYLMRHSDFLNFNQYGVQPLHNQSGTNLVSAGVPGKLWGLPVIETTNLATSMTKGQGEAMVGVISAPEVTIVDKRPFTVKQNPYIDAEMERVAIVGTARMATVLKRPKAAYWMTNVVQ